MPRPGERTSILMTQAMWRLLLRPSSRSSDPTPSHCSPSAAKSVTRSTLPWVENGERSMSSTEIRRK